MLVRAAVVAAAGLGLSACATLGALGLGLRPLRFEAARDRPAELRLGGGRLGLPDAATLRLWAHEAAQLAGYVYVDITGRDPGGYVRDAKAMVEQMVKLPSGYRLEWSGSFQAMERAGGVIARAVSGQPLAYRLEGRFTVDAGPLGTPSFGPSTLLRGEVRPFR